MSTLEGYKILIADDDQEIKATLRQGFLSQGMDVFEASTSDELMTMAIEQRFDVIIINNMMLGAPGVDTIRAIRTIHADQRVVVLTSCQEGCCKKVSPNLDIANFLVKPVTWKQILHAVSDELGHEEVSLDPFDHYHDFDSQLKCKCEGNCEQSPV